MLTDQGVFLHLLTDQAAFHQLISDQLAQLLFQTQFDQPVQCCQQKTEFDQPVQ